MRRGICLALLLAVAACRPVTIAEAERKGDVAWLDQNGTPDAVAALGRLADASPKAVAALEARSTFDVEAFRAAWAAVGRGQGWGPAMMHAGLGDPKRADLAAMGMTKRDPNLAVYVPDLEAALQRLSATLKNYNVSSTLASAGAPARPAILRRLADASTRGAMCRGIGSKDADRDARKALVDAPIASRNADECVDAAVRIAAEDEPTLVWLADRAEPGLVGAAGKSDAMPCAKLHVLWARALASRDRSAYDALTVPLGYAVKRCPAELDGVLADSIVHLPATHVIVVDAIDPFEGYGRSLHATCDALPVVLRGGDAEVVKERASDALSHACKAPG